MPRHRPLLAAALTGLLALLAGCDESGPWRAPTAPITVTTDPIDPAPDSTGAAGDTNPAAPAFVPARTVVDTILVRTWSGGKRAACTFAFDDTRTSHYSIAAPELEARGMRGTFNLVTSAVHAWRDWQGLLDRGHEIANHTRTHRYFHQVTPAEAREEIEGGLHDLLANLRGLSAVPSFAYPGGAVPDWAPDLVARFHTSARGRQGMEGGDPEDFMRLRGYGYYAPFAAEEMDANLDLAIATGGWYVGYYHSIANLLEGDRLTCPLSIYRAHLDHAAGHRASLWIAPQGTVAGYIRARQSFHYEYCGEDGSCLRLLADAVADDAEGVPLTVECRLRGGTRALSLTLDDRRVEIPAGVESLLIDLLPNRTYRFEAELLLDEADLASL